MALPVGALRARLILEVPSETPDGVGGVLRGFAPAATLWARIETLRGQEAFAAASLGQTLTHRVTLRFHAGLDASMRLRLGARLFAIRAIIDAEERRRVLACLCEELAP